MLLIIDHPGSCRISGHSNFTHNVSPSIRKKNNADDMDWRNHYNCLYIYIVMRYIKYQYVRNTYESLTIEKNKSISLKSQSDWRHFNWFSSIFWHRNKIFAWKSTFLKDVSGNKFSSTLCFTSAYSWKH